MLADVRFRKLRVHPKVQFERPNMFYGPWRQLWVGVVEKTSSLVGGRLLSLEETAVAKPLESNLV